MAGIPKVKITFDADFDELKKGIKGGQNEIESFGSKVGDFGKKAGLAFAAAGIAAAAYASKLLIDGVKSAIADEAAQAKLANTLKNVTGATDDQIAATEKYILKTSLANGITDDQLRPSLDRLLRSVKDVTKAQELQSLALDISAGSGKSLEAVSNALAKSAEGQNTALGKLGVGISAAELKTMSFEEITAKLSGTFKDQASKQADTFAGKMARLNVAFDEGKETVGSFVLDAITPMVNTFVKDVVPAIQKFSDEIGPKLQPVIKFLGSYIQEVLLPAFKGIWGFINDFLVPIFSSILTPAINGLRNAFEKVQKAIGDNTEELEPLLDFMKAVGEFARDTLAPIIGTTLKGAFSVLGSIISVTISGFAKIVTAVTNVINAVKAFIKLMTDNPVTRFFGLSGDNSKGLKAGGAEFDPNIGGDIGDPFNGGGGGGGTTFGGNDPRTFTGAPLGAYSPAMQAAILRREELKAETERLRNAREAAAAARLGVTGGLSTAERINITVNGAIDAEGTARTIVETLNDSYFRGTGGASNLQAI
jgi:hypothetical protein